MPRADIVVLNDMHPDEFPGAASIAYSHAKYLSRQFTVSFWHTTSSSRNVSRDQNLEVRAIHINQHLDKLFRSHMATRLLSEFTSPLLFLQITVLLVSNRPKIVWVNQIGYRIPRTISVVFLLLRIKVVQTFHDFGILSPRKLYPQNVSGDGKIELSKRKLINSLYAFRRFLLTSVVNQNFQNICISELQSRIYQSVGVTNIKIIPNGIENCDCLGRANTSERQNEVLFAGRSTGKGFARICQIVKNNPNWKLVVAGGQDLEITVKEFLTLSQFEYLGFLSPSTLFNRIHRVKFVSVVSDCFDVYPTVALEGLVHNSKLLTTETTGIAKFLKTHGGGVLLDANSTNLDLDSLYDNCLDISSHSLSLTSIELSVQAYTSLFLSTMVPTY
jgi:glycosyltransferase involved in cell wall biosynthesis